MKKFKKEIKLFAREAILFWQNQPKKLRYGITIAFISSLSNVISMLEVGSLDLEVLKSEITAFLFSASIVLLKSWKSWAEKDLQK